MNATGILDGTEKTKIEDLSEYQPIVQHAAQHPRIAGAILVAIAAAIGKSYVVDVLEKLRYCAEVSIYPMIIIVGAICLELGLMYLIGGRRAVLLMAKKKFDTRNVRIPQLAIAFCMCLSGLALLIWLLHELSAHGLYR